MTELERSHGSPSEESCLEENVHLADTVDGGVEGSPLSDVLCILHFHSEVDNLPDFLPIVIVTLGVFMCQALGLNIFPRRFNVKNLSFLKFNVIN